MSCKGSKMRRLDRELRMRARRIWRRFFRVLRLAIRGSIVTPWLSTSPVSRKGSFRCLGMRFRIKGKKGRGSKGAFLCTEKMYFRTTWTDWLYVSLTLRRKRPRLILGVWTRRLKVLTKGRRFWLVWFRGLSYNKSRLIRFIWTELRICISWIKTR
jgi:hypothetical protein